VIYWDLTVEFPVESWDFPSVSLGTILEKITAISLIFPVYRWVFSCESLGLYRQYTCESLGFYMHYTFKLLEYSHGLLGFIGPI
jgi:hypothetical protein